MTDYSEYFLSVPNDRHEDNWTYGEWRQYVCQRGDGSTQCARQSSAGFYAWLIGLTALIIGAFPFFLELVHGVDMYNASTWACFIFGLVVCTLLIGCQAEGIWLMRSVGPRQYGETRVFDHEVPLYAILGDHIERTLAQLEMDPAFDQFLVRTGKTKGCMVYGDKQVKFVIATRPESLYGLEIQQFITYQPCDPNLELLASTRVRAVA